MKHADVEILEKIMGQIEGLHSEISALAKKSPNDGLAPYEIDNLIGKTLLRDLKPDENVTFSDVADVEG